MKHVLKLSFVLLHLSLTLRSVAQSKLSLEKVIRIAQEQSLDHKIADNKNKSAYWNYNIFKASLLPKLSLTGTIPNYNRTINRVTIPNGEDVFVSQNQAYSAVSLNATQNVGITGGVLSVNSSLNRIDIFGEQKRNRYSAVPFSFSYTQNSIFYNDLKWQKKTALLQLEESKRAYNESMEYIALSAVDKYFSYLTGQSQLDLDHQNYLIADSLLKITELKFSIGTKDKNDLLQAKLNLLNAKNSIIQDRINLENTKQDFIQFLTLERTDSITLTLPENLIFFSIDLNQAINQATANREKVIEFRRRRLEAEKNILQIRSGSGPTFSIIANMGLSQTNENFGKTYQDLQRQQSISIQIGVPLLDWGVNKSKRKKSEADLELTQNSIQQEEMAFEQEISLQVMKWNSLSQNLQNVAEAKNIALDRFEIAKEKYITSSMSFTEFFSAQQQKDLAINGYVNALRTYWLAYYTIRRLTMFNFVDQQRINY